MKTIKSLLYTISLLLLTACGNGWLDMDPSTSIIDGEEPTLARADNSINGIYSLMQSSDAYSGRMIYYADVTGDDIQAYSETKRCGSYYLFKYTKDNAPSSFWRNPYEIIRNSNIILSYIDDLNIQDKDKVKRDDIKGQALALRALALFDLTRIYGEPFTKNGGSSWGATIVKDIPAIDYKPKRNTVKECYDAIIEDLEAALPLLKDVRDEANKGKINKWAAMTLLSRVYLYCEKNTEALKTAEDVISGAKAKSFRLWTNEEYATAWTQAFTPEVLFEIVNITTDSPGKESMGYLCSSTGYKDMILTSSFIAFMNKDKSDVRNKVIKVVSKRYYINKYPGQQSEGELDANIPIYRMSELYLNAAEAAVKLGNNDKAVTYLDEIVKRANPAKTVQGTTITLERVLDERRKEFFGEGHRLFDAMRNNQTIERKDDASVGAASKHLPMSAESKKFTRDYYKIILPIPKYEMDANPNMRDQQNPGY